MVNVTTMGLIIASGLGFNVWWDLGERIKLVFQKKAFSWQIIPDPSSAEQAGFDYNRDFAPWWDNLYFTV